MFKSKDSIELTLLYIGLQKSFLWNFFWEPILWGMGAAVVMPIITASYALIVGVINAIRDDSGTVGADLWEAFKKSSEAKRDAARLEKSKIEERSEELSTNCQREEIRINDLKEWRIQLEDYLLEFVRIYESYSHSNLDNRDLAGFIAAIEESEITKKFPRSLQLKNMIEFIKSETTVTESSEADLDAGANNSSEIHTASKKSN